MKYLIFEDRSGLEYPILFGEHMAHKDVQLNGFTHPLPLTRIVSAGECKIGCGANLKVVATCYGMSHGYKIKSRGEVDAAIIERMLKI